MPSRMYKRTKMGALPGDWPRYYKIRMLEQGINPGPDGCLTAKTFRRDFVKKANRRFRHNRTWRIDET